MIDPLTVIVGGGIVGGITAVQRARRSAALQRERRHFLEAEAQIRRETQRARRDLQDMTRRTNEELLRFTSGRTRR